MTVFARAAGDLPTVAPHRAVPVAPSHSRLDGLAIGDVTLDPSGFWGERQSVNAAATFDHCVAWMERLGWLENFDRVARGDVTVDRPGWQFSDSEIYKLLEAAAWELFRAPSDALGRTYERLVARATAAQDTDGYLGTAFGHPGLEPRYSDMAMGHELYNMGHLIQAGVARLRTAGEDALTRAAMAAADHICEEFGEDGRQEICGHPEVEVALAELARATGNPRYLEQARLFVDRRGHGSLGVRPLLAADYYQDDIPVREADALRGHAVRALYLSAGAVDVATDGDDPELFDAILRQWERTVSRRTYITGGMGSRHQDEGFGDDWELPPDRAYCESCAGVASIMLAWRLFLATGEARYPDLIERTLYNIVATAQREDGRAFFYANPLQEREIGPIPDEDRVNTRAEGGTRAPWFEVSCCPTNIARTLASLGAYVAATEGNALVIAQHMPGTVRADLPVGSIAVEVTTAYPHRGTVHVRIVEAPEGEATIRLRVPSWASGAVGSSPAGDEPGLPTGWWSVTRTWQPGETLVLDLDDAPQLVWPDSRIDAVRGTVAVTRGPLVMCLESTDLADPEDFAAVAIDTTVPPRPAGDGAVITARIAPPVVADGGEVPFSTRAVAPASATATEVPLVPYHRWATRAPSLMRIHIPVARAEAPPS